MSPLVMYPNSHPNPDAGDTCPNPNAFPNPDAHPNPDADAPELDALEHPSSQSS